METQTDPVCRMQVDPDDAAGQSEYQGRTYYFCSDSCKTQFDENPARYTGSAAGQTGS
jgi:Cu+-exporting ATPase